jgi:hypothetical protein
VAAIDEAVPAELELDWPFSTHNVFWLVVVLAEFKRLMLAVVMVLVDVKLLISGLFGDMDKLTRLVTSIGGLFINIVDGFACITSVGLTMAVAAAVVELNMDIDLI